MSSRNWEDETKPGKRAGSKGDLPFPDHRGTCSEHWCCWPLMTTPLAATALQSWDHTESTWGVGFKPRQSGPRACCLPQHEEHVKGGSVIRQMSEWRALPKGAVAFRLVVWDPQGEMHFRSQTSIETHHIQTWNNIYVAVYNLCWQPSFLFLSLLFFYFFSCLSTLSYPIPSYPTYCIPFSFPGRVMFISESKRKYSPCTERLRKDNHLRIYLEINFSPNQNLRMSNLGSLLNWFQDPLRDHKPQF